METGNLQDPANITSLPSDNSPECMAQLQNSISLGDTSFLNLLLVSYQDQIKTLKDELKGMNDMIFDLLQIIASNKLPICPTLWCLINVTPRLLIFGNFSHPRTLFGHPRLLIFENFCFSNYKIFKILLSKRGNLTNISVSELY